MSTELKSHSQNVTLTRFFGGKVKGSCVQVTQPRKDTNLELSVSDNFFTSLQLTRAQAAALAADLNDFAQGREQEDI